MSLCSRPRHRPLSRLACTRLDLWLGQIQADGINIDFSVAQAFGDRAAAALVRRPQKLDRYAGDSTTPFATRTAYSLGVTPLRER